MRDKHCKRERRHFVVHLLFMVKTEGIEITCTEKKSKSLLRYALLFQRTLFLPSLFLCLLFLDRIIFC